MTGRGELLAVGRTRNPHDTRTQEPDNYLNLVYQARIFSAARGICRWPQVRLAKSSPGSTGFSGGSWASGELSGEAKPAIPVEYTEIK